MNNQLVHYQLVRNRTRDGYVYTLHEAISDLHRGTTHLWALDPLPMPEYCFDDNIKAAWATYRELEPRYADQFGEVDFDEVLYAVDRYDGMMLTGQIPLYYGEDEDEDAIMNGSEPEYEENDKVIDLVEYMRKRG